MPTSLTTCSSPSFASHVVIITLWTLLTSISAILGQGHVDQGIVDVERALLSQLGFDERPHPATDPKATHLPEHIMDLYKMNHEVDSPMKPFPGDTIRTFRPSDDLHRMVSVEGSSIPSFHFDLSSLVNRTGEVTHGVELRIHSSSLAPLSPEKSYVVSLYDVYGEVVVRLLQRRRLQGVQGDDWLTFDVGRSLQESVRSRQSQFLRFAVKVHLPPSSGSLFTDHQSEVYPIDKGFSSADISSQPTLTVYGETTRSLAKRRSKRAASSSTSSSSSEQTKRRSKSGRRRNGQARGQTRGQGGAKGRSGRRKRRKGKKGSNHKCKRRPLYVSFADVGWKDWIMAPSGYDAFYCSGRCRGFLANHMNATNHAIVRSLVHSVRIDTPVLEPCCVPTDLAPLTLLYTERNKAGGSNSVLKIYDDMVVKSCGCR